MNESKKIAAATAAVFQYIRMEEEVLCLQAATGGIGPEPVLRKPSLNLWGLSGRQAIMQMGSLMQLKAMHGLNFRR